MPKRPNVILIVADDMGYGDFGLFNDGPARTPCLDELATQGICLTQHYAGSPACSPSRAALLTGRYPHRTGALTPMEVRGMDRIALDEVTIGDMFKQSGYATGLIGKWHNGAFDKRYHPNARGFEEFFGFCGGWMDYFDWWLDRNGRRETADGRYLTDVFTEEAIDFITRHGNDSFLLSVMYNAPHTPLQAPDDAIQPYLDAGLSPGVAITYAMNEIMDRGVARIVETLDKLGLAENTILMFTSDNGPAFSLAGRPDQVPEGVSTDLRRYNCGFNGAKGSVYEGGVRVPMVMCWPGGLERCRQVDEMVHGVDWLPTLAALCGIKCLEGRSLDGRDASKVLYGESNASPARFWQLNQFEPVGWINAAMREGAWKLVRPHVAQRPKTEADERFMERYIELDIKYKYYPDEMTELMSEPPPDLITSPPVEAELYNIDDDPLEKINLAISEPERTGRMLGELQAWFEDVEAERQRIQLDGSIVEIVDD
ncbi:MAG: sulfatase-like hydrolase/transferase [Candidatus Latescibacterota bacterium]|nr:sulfatase-like hydrolase/transferase [Candidatus Latescibacterota bacterium]